jgi:hypothetical protein
VRPAPAAPASTTRSTATRCGSTASSSFGGTLYVVDDSGERTVLERTVPYDGSHKNAAEEIRA